MLHKEWPRWKLILLFMAIIGVFAFHYWVMERLYHHLFFQPAIIPMTNVADRQLFMTAPYPDLSYAEINPPKKLENLHVIGRVSRHGVYAKNEKEKLVGMTMRVLRFQNISQKVETKYGLPQNIILAMVMQESGGAHLVLNAGDDGGAGLCHMQPYTARQFGLKTYQDCKRMVSRVHGRRLRKLIQKNDSLPELIRYDDRFHPIKNMDAVGRMLAFYSRGKQLEDTQWKTAIRWYAGRNNYRYYYRNVSHYRQKLNSTGYIDTVRQRFNAINPNFTIAGKAADFDDYLQYNHQQNINYGLKHYR